MKIPSFYFIGIIFLFVGLAIKIPSFLLQIDYLFEIGLCFSGIGIIFLAVVILKNRGWNFDSLK